jgi:hypothetical protein
VSYDVFQWPKFLLACRSHARYFYENATSYCTKSLHAFLTGYGHTGKTFLRAERIHRTRMKKPAYLACPAAATLDSCRRAYWYRLTEHACMQFCVLSSIAHW